VDLDRADAVIADLEDYRRHVEPWTPERVAETCGIEAEVVVRLAREFAQARPALIRAGVGATQSVDGESFVRSLSALALLGGHWEHRGGGLYMGTSPEINDVDAARADLRPRPTRSLDLARLGSSLTDPVLDPPVHALVVWGANPAVSQPDARRVREGLARDDLFVVVLEHFLTDTARYADVVLPSTTQLEHFDAQSSWGHQYVSVNNAAVPPLGEAKSHGEVMRLLAPRLGLIGPAFRESDEQIVASVLPDGITLEELKQAGWHKAPTPRFHPGSVPERLRITPEPLALPEQPRGRLHLLTPKAHHFLNSTFANMPAQRRAMVGPTLDLHPADAAERGLYDEQEVLVSNERGSVTARVRVTEDVRRGVAALPGKWWDADGGIGNMLSPGRWSRGGQPAYNEIFVEVTAVDPAGTCPTAAGGRSSATTSASHRS
jgi:anaerobic selenocysteine-containing dehydrogenase